MNKKYINTGLILILIMVFALGVLAGCGKKTGDETAATVTTRTEEVKTGAEADDETAPGGEAVVSEDGTYDSKEDVAAYIVAFGKLPSNYITKDEARSMGWSGGSVEKYAPGKCIGGDRFGDYEGKLPDGEYRECDIDTIGYKDRGSRRLVFSDEEIYYTHDHYRHFEKVCDR